MPNGTHSSENDQHPHIIVSRPARPTAQAGEILECVGLNHPRGDWDISLSPPAAVRCDTIEDYIIFINHWDADTLELLECWATKEDWLDSETVMELIY